MSRNVLFLPFVLLSVVCLSSKPVFAAVTDQAKIDSAPAPVATISSDDIQAAPSVSATVIGSRLPSKDQLLKDVPSNVTVRDKKKLNEQRPQSFQEALYDEEGTYFFDNVGNGVDTSLGIRGFTTSRIPVLVDGVRVNEVDGNAVHAPLLSMDDLESIQVNRGSSSPIYGSDAFGGVINLTSGQPRKKPVTLFGGLDWSSWEGLRFYQGASGTLQDKVTPLGGKFEYYFRGGRNVNDGFRANGDWRMTSFDFKTGYVLPEDQASLRFGLKHADNSISNPGELTFQQYQDDPYRTNKPWNGRKYDVTTVQLSGDAKFWDDRIIAEFLSSQRYSSIHALTTFATFADADSTSAADTNFVTLENKEFNQTAQLKYEDTWDFVTNRTLLGMEFRRGSNTSTQRDAFDGIINDNFGTETDRNAHAENVGLFWRESLSFYDKIIPYVGMRHDWHDVISANQLNNRQNISSRWHDSTVSTGLTVHPVRYADLFFNYAQGFRVPTLDELVPFSGTAASDLTPETSDSYETGVRLRYEDIALSKFTFFVIDLEDEIRFDSSAVSATAPFGQNINISKSRREGIEIHQEWNPLKEVKLYGGYTWMKAYVREIYPTASLVDGRDLGNIPQNRFHLGTMLRPLAGLGEPYEGFRMGLHGVFTGKNHPDSYESTSQATLNSQGGMGHVIKAYSVWDFIAAFNWRNQEIFFKINNIFDEKYYSRAVNGTAFTSLIYPAGTHTWVNPGAPREYVLGSRWEF